MSLESYTVNIGVFLKYFSGKEIHERFVQNLRTEPYTIILTAYYLYPKKKKKGKKKDFDVTTSKHSI